jgi:ADP-ribose pyrophosphatase YjhB (NUDIX family)
MARKKQPEPMPVALACGLLEDKERALFLVRKNTLGQEIIELPFVFVMIGENPVATLASAFRQKTGIDAQVHESVAEKSFNAGTRKRKHFIHVLVFRMSAKNHAARASSEFSGYKWLKHEEAVKFKLAKEAQWLY